MGLGNFFKVIQPVGIRDRICTQICPTSKHMLLITKVTALPLHHWISISLLPNHTSQNLDPQNESEPQKKSFQKWEPLYCIFFFVFFRLTLHIYISKFARNSATKKSTWLWLTHLSLEYFFFFSDISNMLRTLLPRISIQKVICRILTIFSALI